MNFEKKKCCLDTELADEEKNVTMEMTILNFMYDQLLKNVYLFLMVKKSAVILVR